MAGRRSIAAREEALARRGHVDVRVAGISPTPLVWRIPGDYMIKADALCIPTLLRANAWLAFHRPEQTARVPPARRTLRRGSAPWR
jgi:hypothetical protein